jgi:hypothetical protein
MTTLLMVRDVTGAVTFGIPPSSDCFSMLLETGVEQSITVPKQNTNYLAIFSATPGASVWVAYNGKTASVPSGTASETDSELLPGPKLVSGNSELSFITSSTTDVELGVTFYAVP